MNNPVDIALKKFENHPSIFDIKENVTPEANVSFSIVAISDIQTEIRKLDTGQARSQIYQPNN